MSGHQDRRHCRQDDHVHQQVPLLPSRRVPRWAFHPLHLEDTPARLHRYHRLVVSLGHLRLLLGDIMHHRWAATMVPYRHGAEAEVACVREGLLGLSLIPWVVEYRRQIQRFHPNHNSSSLNHRHRLLSHLPAQSSLPLHNYET